MITIQLNYVTVIISNASLITYEYFYKKGTYKKDLLSILKENIPCKDGEWIDTNISKRLVAKPQNIKVTGKDAIYKKPRLLILGTDETDAKHSVLDIRGIPLDEYDIHYWSMSWRSNEERILQTVLYYLAMFELSHVSIVVDASEEYSQDVLNKGYNLLSQCYLSIDSGFRHDSYFEQGDLINYDAMQLAEKRFVVEQFATHKEAVLLMEYEADIKKNYFYIEIIDDDPGFEALELKASGKYKDLFDDNDYFLTDSVLMYTPFMNLITDKLSILQKQYHLDNPDLCVIRNGRCDEKIIDFTCRQYSHQFNNVITIYKEQLNSNTLTQSFRSYKGENDTQEVAEYMFGMQDDSFAILTNEAGSEQLEKEAPVVVFNDKQQVLSISRHDVEDIQFKYVYILENLMIDRLESITYVEWDVTEVPIRLIIKTEIL